MVFSMEFVFSMVTANVRYFACKLPQISAVGQLARGTFNTFVVSLFTKQFLSYQRYSAHQLRRSQSDALLCGDAFLV